MTEGGPAAAGHLVVGHVFEALYVRALGTRISAACRGQLREAGLDLDHPLRDSYPIAVWRTCTELVTAGVFPGVPPAEAHYQLGELLVEGYTSTLIGTVLAPVLKLFNPVRALDRVVKNLRIRNAGKLQPRVTQLQPNLFEIDFPDLGPHPHLMRGALAAALRYTSMKHPRVELLAHEARPGALRVSWDL